MPLPEFAGRAVIPNAADEAYAAVLLDDLSWHAALGGLSDLPDPLLRAVTWTNASTRVRSGLSPVGDYLAAVQRHLAGETDPVVFDSVLRRLMRVVLPQWTSPEAYPDAERVVAEVCAAALAAGDADRGLAAMRRLAQTTADATLLRGWLDSGEARPGLEVDRDTRWLAVRRLVVLGEADTDLVEAEAATDRTSNGHQSSLTALASRPDPAAKARRVGGDRRPERVQPRSSRPWSPGCGHRDRRSSSRRTSPATSTMLRASPSGARRSPPTSPSPCRARRWRSTGSRGSATTSTPRPSGPTTPSCAGAGATPWTTTT